MIEDRIEKGTVESNNVTNDADSRDTVSCELSSLVQSVRETPSLKGITTAKDTKLGQYRFRESPYKSKPPNFSTIYNIAFISIICSGSYAQLGWTCICSISQGG
jgi:hypothetical protein